MILISEHKKATQDTLRSCLEAANTGSNRQENGVAMTATPFFGLCAVKSFMAFRRQIIVITDSRENLIQLIRPVCSNCTSDAV